MYRINTTTASAGFVSLSWTDAGFNLVYLRTGLETFKPEALAGHDADGLLVAFVVDDIDAEYERLRAEVEIWRSPPHPRPRNGASATSR